MNEKITDIPQLTDEQLRILLSSERVRTFYKKLSDELLGKIQTTEDKIRLGSNIQALMLFRGLDQLNKLAPLVPMDRGYLSRITRGDMVPSIDTLLGIAAVLKIDPRRIVEEDFAKAFREQILKETPEESKN